MLRLNYVLQGDNESARLEFCETTGTPAIETVYVHAGLSIAPAVQEGATIGEPIVNEPFIRGDTNQDGIINVADAVVIAKAVFGLGSKLQLVQNCMDSADANDDEAMDTTDALYILRYLFEGDTPIPPPNVCGNDPTPEAGGLDCPDYPPCPR